MQVVDDTGFPVDPKVSKSGSNGEEVDKHLRLVLPDLPSFREGYHEKQLSVHYCVSNVAGSVLSLFAQGGQPSEAQSQMPTTPPREVDIGSQGAAKVGRRQGLYGDALLGLEFRSPPTRNTSWTVKRKPRLPRKDVQVTGTLDKEKS